MPPRSIAKPEKDGRVAGRSAITDPTSVSGRSRIRLQNRHNRQPTNATRETMRIGPNESRDPGPLRLYWLKIASTRLAIGLKAIRTEPPLSEARRRHRRVRTRDSTHTHRDRSPGDFGLVRFRSGIDGGGRVWRAAGEPAGVAAELSAGVVLLPVPDRLLPIPVGLLRIAVRQPDPLAARDVCVAARVGPSVRGDPAGQRDALYGRFARNAAALYFASALGARLGPVLSFGTWQRDDGLAALKRFSGIGDPGLSKRFP